ncbi:MAG: dicarboxylate/amino acid:cation symporter, partial [Acidobacteriales bacterium]|nr:dicarboxylate/amino acid:cation symporter [Terriglobales bacterium]
MDLQRRECCHALAGSDRGMMFKRFLPALIAGAMILGVLAGFVINTRLPPDQAKAAAASLSIITDLFLRLIRMIIAPLVFSTLVAGIAHMEDSAAIGR